MAIFRWGQSWDPFHDLEQELDRLLHSVHQTFHMVRSARSFPQCNIVETPVAYIVTAQIPGVEARSIEVTISAGSLILKGVRRPPEESREDSYRRRERFHGAWQRKISLPDRVNEDNMKADYSAGILRITLPRATPGRARQIAVNEGP